MSRQRVFLLILFSLLALSLTAFPGCGKAATTNIATAPQNPTATTKIVPPGNTTAAPQNPSTTAAATTPTNTTTAPEPNNVEPRQVAVGEEFPVILREDPASGYTWEANFDSALIEQVSTSYVAPSTTGTGGGERDFQFKVLKKGLTSIILQLKAPGNESSKDSKILLFGIDQSLPNIIQDAGPVSTNAGEQFNLTVNEKHTGGYQWEAVFDSAYLQLVSNTLNQDTSERTFQFEALKQGVTGLNLVLGGMKSPQQIQVDTVSIK